MVRAPEQVVEACRAVPHVVVRAFLGIPRHIGVSAHPRLRPAIGDARVPTPSQASGLPQARPNPADVGRAWPAARLADAPRTRTFARLTEPTGSDALAGSLSDGRSACALARCAHGPRGELSCAASVSRRRARRPVLCRPAHHRRQWHRAHRSRYWPHRSIHGSGVPDPPVIDDRGSPTLVEPSHSHARTFAGRAPFEEMRPLDARRPQLKGKRVRQHTAPPEADEFPN